MLASAKMKMMMNTKVIIIILCWSTEKQTIKETKKETKMLGENYKAVPCTGLILVTVRSELSTFSA